MIIDKYFPIEIQCEITKFLYDLKDVLNMSNLSNNHRNYIRITNLYDISKKYKPIRFENGKISLC